METVQHKIQAYLYANLFSNDNPNDYIARTSSERSLNVKQICEAAVVRGGADVSTAAMEHAVELFLKEMAYQLCDGFSVNTGYFTGNTVIRGVFDSPREKFNANKHNILFQFHQGEKLRAEIPHVEVDIMGIVDNITLIQQVTDVKTGSVNDVITTERNLKIVGNKLKVTGDNVANGVFFIDQATGERVKVDASEMVVNNPSELIVVVPALSQGAYLLEVVTQYAGTNVLKAPRIATFKKELTVQ